MLNAFSTDIPMVTIEVIPSNNPIIKRNAKHLAHCSLETLDAIHQIEKRFPDMAKTCGINTCNLMDMAVPEIVERGLVEESIIAFAKKRDMADDLDLSHSDAKTGPNIKLRCTEAFAKALSHNCWRIWGIKSVRQSDPHPPSP